MRKYPRKKPGTFEMSPFGDAVTVSLEVMKVLSMHQKTRDLATDEHTYSENQRLHDIFKQTHTHHNRTSEWIILGFQKWLGLPEVSHSHSPS